MFMTDSFICSNEVPSFPSKTFAGYELAVIVADGPLLGSLAGELGALETKFDAFSEGTRSYSAKLILFRCTPALPVRALPLDHHGTLLTSNTTDTYLHLLPPGHSPPEADAPKLEDTSV